MEQKKFLTVMAVLDEETQLLMHGLQQRIITSGMLGTQTMNIPFHITLGSYPPECEKALVSRIAEISADTKEITLSFPRLHTFGHTVLFAEPAENSDLNHLHLFFDSNYGNGFPWVPHATLFCGQNDEVIKAFSLIEKQFQAFQAKITAIELGRFFPAEFVCRYDLKKH